MKRYCVLTDCFRSGNLLVPELLERGLDVIHVISSPRAVEVYTKSDYQDRFTLEFVHDDLVHTLARLGDYSIEGVIAASETGVLLADQIAERLGVLNNGTQLSEARRNKYQMMEALRRAGVPHPKTLLTNSLAGALEWIARETTYPVILKPKDSACTDSVFRCDSEAQVESAFGAIYGQRNRTTLLSNVDVLVQEFLAGTEYAIDMVSRDGRHVPASIWRYSRISRNESAFVYDTMTLLPARGEVQDSLVTYTAQVLDALGISHGPTHTEVIVTQAGPRLVESGARMCGAFAPALVREVTGYAQAQMSADAVFAPAEFRTRTGEPYALAKQALRVFLISHQEGEIRDFPALPAIRNLRSFYALVGSFAPGTRVVKTVDLYTNPGIVDLAHEDPVVLAEDYRFIRELEVSGLFSI